MMIITFIGHGSLPAGVDLAEKVRSGILTVVPEGEKVTFYCGGYGDFDRLCAGVCRSLKPELSGSEIVFVAPYFTESYQKKILRILEEKLYDDVVYPPLECVPPRLAILKRNQWMVERADLIFSYVTHSFGGAATTLAFAKRKKKTVVNLT